MQQNRNRNNCFFAKSKTCNNQVKESNKSGNNKNKILEEVTLHLIGIQSYWSSVTKYAIMLMYNF